MREGFSALAMDAEWIFGFNHLMYCAAADPVGESTSAPASH